MSLKLVLTMVARARGPATEDNAAFLVLPTQRSQRRQV